MGNKKRPSKVIKADTPLSTSKRAAEVALPRKSKGKKGAEVVKAGIRRVQDQNSNTAPNTVYPKTRDEKDAKTVTAAPPLEAGEEGLKSVLADKSVEAQKTDPVAEEGTVFKGNDLVAPSYPIGKAPTNAFTPESAKAARKLRLNYGKKLPPVVCDSCAFATQCPQFKPSYVCAFMDMIDGIKIDTLDDVKEAQKRIIEANLTTAELGLIQQRLAGGVIDDKTSHRLDAAFEQLAEMRRLEHSTLMGNAKMDQVSVSGPGLIERLFGNFGKVAPTEKQPTLINVTPEVKAPIKDVVAVEREMKPLKDAELDEVLQEFKDKV